MEILPGLKDEHPTRTKRGRPPSSLSTNFFRLNEKCNKTMWWTVCKYCYAAHVNDKQTISFPVNDDFPGLETIVVLGVTRLVSGSVYRLQNLPQLKPECVGVFYWSTKRRRCILADSEFWVLLTSAERIVRPLCAASFRLQRDENTVADVVISFAATEFSNALADCVEARWNACEQPLFILGYYLHPNFVAEARELPLTVLTDLDDVCQLAQYYYRRFIGTDDSGLRGDMFAWIEGTFTTSRPSDFNTDVVLKFWEYEKKAKPNSKLPALALTVLAIAVNTATCERLFSELALIHTPKRNKMTVEKPMKHQIMR
ncbi:Hypothetical protein PHPALM_3669 [Phytophthora palmivora]|uniref:HAT C-terminal dimerisation domain-containing protein n=1 Tax=Phytophthora palmivora TaxID=4796 RepID=A0A2P4YLT6_9STRA|nr:Hypothetical protein PHPALM_3669 [Phytophthora palmivora]